MKTLFATLAALSLASAQAGEIPLRPYGYVFAPPGYVWDFGMKRDSDCGTIRSRHFEINLDFGEAAGVYTKGLVEKVVKSFHGKVLRDYQILKPDLRLHLILYSAEGKNHAVASYPEYRGNFWCEYTESADLADFMTIVTSFTPAKEASPQK